MKKDGVITPGIYSSNGIWFIPLIGGALEITSALYI